MTITITGASGFLGRNLIRRLSTDGHEIRTLGRHPVGGTQFLEWKGAEAEPPGEALGGADAVIHLAGEPVAQRWTQEVKHKIRSSRVVGTRNLVHALYTIARRPPVLVCASAIGFYGPRGDEILTEQSDAGRGFLARTTEEWEREAQLAEALGMRVVRMRIGIVLGSDGGALTKMLPPFRAGVGGKLGSGRQWMSWIHVDDAVGLFLLALHDSNAIGPINVTAPEPVRNEQFTRDLAAVLHRAAIFPVPRFALALLYGEMSGILVESQRVLPKAAESLGYQFRHPALRPALESLSSGSFSNCS